MNTDIRIKTSIKGHRKLRKLARGLDIIEVTAMGHLTFLWLRVAVEAPKGILKGWSIQEIADAAEWEGDASIFIEKLCDKNAAWLEWDGRKKCYTLHDWEVHQGWAFHADERSEQGKKAINSRWGRDYTDSNTASNTGSNTPSPSPIPSPITSPYPSPNPKPYPNHTPSSPKRNSIPITNPFVEAEDYI